MDAWVNQSLDWCWIPLKSKVDISKLVFLSSYLKSVPVHLDGKNMPTTDGDSVEHKSTEWKWNWRVQSCISHFTTLTLYEVNSNCSLYMPPYCCDIMYLYVNEVVFVGSCPGFQLWIPLFMISVKPKVNGKYISLTTPYIRIYVRNWSDMVHFNQNNIVFLNPAKYFFLSIKPNSECTMKVWCVCCWYRATLLFWEWWNILFNELLAIELFKCLFTKLTKKQNSRFSWLLQFNLNIFMKTSHILIDICGSTIAV